MNIKTLLFVPLLFCSCAKKNSLPKKPLENVVKYKKVFVDGVECKYCAQAAVSRLEKIPAVKRADFVCKGDNWECGHVRIFATEDIADGLLHQELAKEGFGLKVKGLKKSHKVTQKTSENHLAK